MLDGVVANYADDTSDNICVVIVLHHHTHTVLYNMWPQTITLTALLFLLCKDMSTSMVRFYQPVTHHYCNYVYRSKWDLISLGLKSCQSIKSHKRYLLTEVIYSSCSRNITVPHTNKGSFLLFIWPRWLDLKSEVNEGPGGFIIICPLRHLVWMSLWKKT